MIWCVPTGQCPHLPPSLAAEQQGFWLWVRQHLKHKCKWDCRVWNTIKLNSGTCQTQHVKLLSSTKVLCLRTCLERDTTYVWPGTQLLVLDFGLCHQSRHYHTVKQTWDLGWRWKEGWTTNNLPSKWELDLNKFHVPKHRAIERRFRDPFLPSRYYPVPPAVTGIWKVGPEFRYSSCVTCIHSSTSAHSLGCQAASSILTLSPASSLGTWLCSHSWVPVDAALSNSPVSLCSSLISQNGCWQSEVNANEISSVSLKSSWKLCTRKFRCFTQLRCTVDTAAQFFRKANENKIQNLLLAHTGHS